MLMQMICTIDLLGSVCFSTNFNDKNFKELGYTNNDKFPSLDLPGN